MSRAQDARTCKNSRLDLAIGRWPCRCHAARLRLDRCHRPDTLRVPSRVAAIGRPNRYRPSCFNDCSSFRRGRYRAHVACRRPMTQLICYRVSSWAVNCSIDLWLLSLRRRIPNRSSIHRVGCAPALAYIVPVPIRDLDNDIVIYHGLTTEPRAQRQPGRHVKPIFLAFLHLRQTAVALVNNDVTCGAGAVATAGMLERHPEIESNIEHRLGLAMFVVG